MRLILTGLLVGLKRSAAPFLLLFAAMLCWSGVLAPFAREEEQPAPVRIGVLDEERGAFSPLLLSLLQKPLGQAAELRILAPGDPQEDCAAVLILPHGFWQGIMDGENLSPCCACMRPPRSRGFGPAPSPARRPDNRNRPAADRRHGAGAAGGGTGRQGA